MAGGGIAGIACAGVLAEAGLDVEVHDRGRVVGGRMASRWMDGRIVDSGASYLTASSPEFTAVVDDWTRRGLTRPWTDRFHLHSPAGGLGDGPPGPLRYAAPRGLRSLVADLVSRSGARIRLQSPITMVTPGPAVDGRRVDAAVLAMPDPQALAHIAPDFDATRAALAGHASAPTLALLAGWPRRCWEPIDGVFVNDDPTLGWICDDGRRRGDEAPVLVAHSTPRFAAGRLADPGAAAGALTDAVRRVLSIAEPPAWTDVQRWSFAKPTDPHDEPFWLTDDGLGLAGDGWGPPRIETAWRSGDALGRAITARTL